MKKQILTTASVLLIIGITIFSCKKKDESGIAPEFGNSGNPTTGNQTVTGTTTYTNPASENTVVQVGGTGWSNPTCGTTNSISLKAVNGNNDVTVSFATAISMPGTFTYAIGSTPGPNVCAMTVLNAPNQPAGITWYAKRGQVIVNAGATSITASLKNVECTQLSFNFPTVVVNGQVSCSQ